MCISSTMKLAALGVALVSPQTSVATSFYEKYMKRKANNGTGARPFEHLVQKVKRDMSQRFTNNHNDKTVETFINKWLWTEHVKKTLTDKAKKHDDSQDLLLTFFRTLIDDMNHFAKDQEVPDNKVVDPVNEPTPEGPSPAYVSNIVKAKKLISTKSIVDIKKYLQWKFKSALKAEIPLGQDMEVFANDDPASFAVLYDTLRQLRTYHDKLSVFANSDDGTWEEQDAVGFLKLACAAARWACGHLEIKNHPCKYKLPSEGETFDKLEAEFMKLVNEVKEDGDIHFTDSEMHEVDVIIEQALHGRDDE